MKRIFNVFAMVSIALASCKKDDEVAQIVSPNYLHGMFVCNEGSYTNNNASITHISNAHIVTDDIYYTQNTVELGDVLQSMTVIGTKGYAVLNNSAKVELINLGDMKNAGTITGTDYPRYIVDGNNGKAYISNGSTSGTVKVINLSTNTIEASITVGNGPEKMLLENNRLWVCNSGGSVMDNSISVIDLASNSVVQTITVGDRPQDIVQDANGDLWVICSGETLYDGSWQVIGHTDAKMFRINADTYAIEAEQMIGQNGDHPRQLAVSPDGQTIYFENLGVFKFDIVDVDFSCVEIIADERGSLDIDPTTGEIWCASVNDFVSASTIHRYSISGSLLGSYQTGLGTNSVVFN